MLIGISGPSCSGKTTLAREVGRLLGAPVMHLDRYFITEADRPLVDGHPSFERPHQYDGDALLRDANRALCDNDIVVAEGFLLFSYLGFELACAHMVHLDVPHDVLAARRSARSEASASDVKGGRIKMADDGWQAHGASEWERFGAFQAGIPGIEVVRTIDHGGSWPSSQQDIASRLIDGWCGPMRQAA